MQRATLSKGFILWNTDYEKKGFFLVWLKRADVAIWPQIYIVNPIVKQIQSTPLAARFHYVQSAQIQPVWISSP